MCLVGRIALAALAKSAGSQQLEVQLGGQAIQQAEKVSLGATTAVGLVAAMIHGRKRP